VVVIRDGDAPGREHARRSELRRVALALHRLVGIIERRAPLGAALRRVREDELRLAVHGAEVEGEKA
jgi:hypothetical protein